MLDGQGCLLPVRHFHRDQTPPMFSSCSGVHKTCLSESSAESDPSPSLYPKSFSPCSLDASESNSGELVNPNPSIPVGCQCFSVSLAKVDAAQTRYSCEDLAEEIPLPTIRAEFDCLSTSQSNCLSTTQDVETGEWSVHGELDAAGARPGSCRSVHTEVSYGHIASENRLDLAEGTHSTSGGEAEIKGGEDGSTVKTAKCMGLCKLKSGRVSEDKDFNRSDAERSPGLGFSIASFYDSKESQDSCEQSGCTEEAEEGAIDILSSHVCSCLNGGETGCKRLRLTVGHVAFGRNEALINTPQTVSGDPYSSNSDHHHQPYLPGLDDESALRCLALVPLSDLGRLSMLGKQYRDLVKSRHIFQLRRMYGMVEHLVFIYTNRLGVWTAYDAKRNAWRMLPPANVNPLFMSSDKESLSAGTHVLWLGKEIFEFVYYRYDLPTNSWDKGPSMVNPRCLFASASCGEFAYVAGGFGPADDMGALRLLNSAERYNSVTGQWELLPPISMPRHKCAGFFMDGKFYVIGGRDANHQPIMSGEEYNPVTRSWRTIPNMYFVPEVARQDMMEPSPPLVAVVNDQLYAVENTTNTLKMYNKHSNTWSNLGLLPVRADLRNGWGVAFKAIGDRLFVMGEAEGIAVCCWRPGPNASALDWDRLEETERGVGCFLYNCAVMAC